MKKLFSLLLAALCCTTIFATPGALKGKFKINDKGDQIVFSRGNLQFQASTGTWRFAEKQMDVIGAKNQNISASYDGWIDLFGWGTGNNPTLTSTDNSDYATFVDWGVNPISNGGNQPNLWRTLTEEEWKYICNERPTELRTSISIYNPNGYFEMPVVLLPDDWVKPEEITKDLKPTTERDKSFTNEEVAILEEAGAVFLQVVGKRSGRSWEFLEDWYYWTSTPNGDDKAGIWKSAWEFIYDERHFGAGVRLVKSAVGEAIDNVQSDKVQSTKVLRDGVLLIERNGKVYNATGVEVK